VLKRNPQLSNMKNQQQSLTQRRTRSRSRKDGNKSTPIILKGKEEYDPWTKFLYVPRTVTFLVLGLLTLTYLSHPFRQPLVADEATSYANRKAGVFAIVCVFLGYSAVQGTSSHHLVRPHPSFWKLVHGVMVCYLLFMVYLLFQTVDDARAFLKHLYPELGVELEERAYGESCALIVDGHVHWKIIKDTVFDEFVIAHTLGWWGKALILREYGMLWTVSITFELLELTFQHLLPNFNECWWDSWILDVAICNFIGILTGMWTVRYFHGKEYNWRGISQQPTLFAKAQRGLMQFTPYSLDNFQWGMFSSPKRCLQCFFPAGIILLFEVNHFFLKYELWVPPRNPLNTIRLSILFLIAIPGIREYYEFIESDSIDIFHRLGPFAWTGVAIAFVEMLVIVKFGHGMFPQPWPTTVVACWSTVGILFIIGFSIWSYSYYVLTPRKKMK
jgi:phosphatidylserine synthase 2